MPERLLVKRFELTVNLSLEGVQEAHDRRRYLATFGAEAAAARADHRDALLLPGVRSGDDHCRRWWRPDVRVASVSFAPTGKSPHQRSIFQAEPIDLMRAFQRLKDSRSHHRCKAGNRIFSHLKWDVDKNRYLQISF